ncbi:MULTISPECIES: tail fiber protein [unclassified Bradyrhizobium]|uniref:tail fiber protein n=1 Tax=unclassified Bradyrhizobium TaxID=2631580 RepID=UPI001FFB311F|nr:MULTISPECIES: tail fiber protein [unclassified Bradyrhizobium]MCK1346345.1 tail fiber protein [Bradyrhizobium sp. CW11]MCK1588539.1 tail fiber protein [Bradyrhizobium sp. 169]
MSSTPYNRQNSFALFSAENPSKQQSGTDLDAEFNAVKIALDDTQQNLALIQDDDGVLKRGSVGQAQFDSSVTLGFATPAQWESGVLYDADISTVFHDSIFYIANVTHTSGVSFEADKWDEIADFTAAAAIPDGSITSAKLATGAVEADKLADGVVSNTKLATGSVTTNKLADGNVITQKLADAAVSFSKLGSDADHIIPAGLGPLPWSLPTLPSGWDWADGGVLLASTAFQTLRQSLIDAGFPHGQDGSGNPKKPDGRGRVMAGADGGANRLTSSYFGSSAVLGAAGGTESVTLSAGQMAPLNISGTTSGSLAVSGSASAVVGDSGGGGIGGGGNFGHQQTIGVAGSTSGSLSVSGSTTNAGGQAHKNVQPTLVCNMIIKAH